MEKKNFEAFTDQQALKKNAIQLCGQEFVNSLKDKGIYAKNDDFWREVNKKLNIPNDANQQKQAIKALEMERKLTEEKAREQAQIERLLINKQEVYRNNRSDWSIAVFDFIETDKYGNKFVAECTKEPDLKLVTMFSKTQGEAYSRACSLVDKFESKQKQLKNFIEHYKVLKPLYLMLIYLSGSDEYNRGDNHEKYSAKNFTEIRSWNGLEFEIVNYLESEELLKLSTTRKSITMTKKGMKAAREILQKINLDGVERLLEQREYHEEYINYKSQLDIIREELEEEE